MKKSLIITLIVALVSCALGVGGTLAVQKFVLKSPDATTTTAKAESDHKDGPVVSVGEFTVNLQGGAYLKTTIAVEGVNAKSEEVLKEKETFLKDRINTVLANKTLEDIAKPDAREKLREDLLAQLNEVTGNQISQVLFVSLVYQQ